MGFLSGMAAALQGVGGGGEIAVLKSTAPERPKLQRGPAIDNQLAEQSSGDRPQGESVAAKAAPM